MSPEPTRDRATRAESPESPHVPPQPQVRDRTYAALDGLRALAVIMVVATHAAFQTGRYERGFGNNALSRLDSGVAIFFVLSGFLLVRPWLIAAARQGAPPSLRIYALRRVTRIMPAYLIALGGAFLLMPENGGARMADWVRHVFFLQIYQPGWLKPGLTQTWSLAVEWSYYLALPLWGALLLRLSRHRWRPRALLASLAGLALVPFLWEWLLHVVDSPHLPTAGTWLPAYCGWFAGGMALAVARVHLDEHRPHQSSRWWFVHRLGAHPWTCWAVAALALFMCMNPLAGPRSLQPATSLAIVTKHSLYLVMAVALVLPAVFGDSSSARAVFGNRFMRWCGDLSYGVFLYHLIVLAGVMALLENEIFTGDLAPVLALTLGGTAALAAASFRLVEAPLLRRAHRYRPPRHRTRKPPRPPR